MTKLSVNINKLATIRNARGGNNPNLIEYAIKIQNWGAHGITIHPRPDERHIRLSDVYELKKVVTTEFNIEGYPSKEFIELVLKIKPEQVTLVPDAPNVLTSNNGWDCKTHLNFLKEVIKSFKNENIRTSIFLNPEPEMVPYAKETGTDRIELYTEFYAKNYPLNKALAIDNYIKTANEANRLNLDLNAGHDLDLNNLKYFSQNIPNLKEVSIGHALICDALEYGMSNVIKMYLNQLK